MQAVVLNTATGGISGTPSTIQPLEQHQVTAANTGGAISAFVRLGVEKAQTVYVSVEITILGLSVFPAAYQQAFRATWAKILNTPVTNVVILKISFTSRRTPSVMIKFYVKMPGKASADAASVAISGAVIDASSSGFIGLFAKQAGIPPGSITATITSLPSQSSKNPATPSPNDGKSFPAWAYAVVGAGAALVVVLISGVVFHYFRKKHADEGKAFDGEGKPIEHTKEIDLELPSMGTVQVSDDASAHATDDQQAPTDLDSTPPTANPIQEEDKFKTRL